jgi:ArsR family transcriptional regulator, arsenate/arsenite/antimonite-responsive transcriptional repressor
MMEMTAALDALGALAQESRLSVFRLLVEQGPAGLAAGQIADRLGIPPATLSFHLSQLGQAGLVTSTRNGRSIVYAADYKGMERLMGFLYENCCQGACVPAARVGRKRKSAAS